MVNNVDQADQQAGRSLASMEPRIFSVANPPTKNTPGKRESTFYGATHSQHGEHRPQPAHAVLQPASMEPRILSVVNLNPWHLRNRSTDTFNGATHFQRGERAGESGCRRARDSFNGATIFSVVN